jgi:hypothetical protein
MNRIAGIGIVVAAFLEARAYAYDTGTTTLRTYLRAGPAARFSIVRWVERGRALQILDEKGPWLRVRVGHHSGWMLRQVVQRDEETPPAARRVEEATFVPEKETPPPPPESEEQRRHWNEEKVVVVAGWVPVAAVQPEKAKAAVRARPAEVIDDTSGPRIEPRLALHTSAAIGIFDLQTTFTSNGHAELANYRVSAAALALRGGAELAYAPGAHLRLGADVRYGFAWSNPGIQYTTAGAMGDVPFEHHEVGAGARLGWRASDVLLSARVGYHFETFYVEDLVNVAKLPRESLQGLSLGGAVEVRNVFDRMTLRAGADVLTPAVRTQTAGGQDGTSVSASALFAGASASLHFGPAWSADAAYRFGWFSTLFSGPSTRQPDVTSAHRTDQEHIITLGAGRTF